VAGGIGFQPKNPPPAYIDIYGSAPKVSRCPKIVYGPDRFYGLDRRRFWPETETIKSPDFYGS
jgi:hypothetical protein